MAGLTLQLAVDCIAAASLFALVALAVTLAHSGTGVLHLGIAQVGVAGALVAAGVVRAGWPLWVAITAGVVVAAAVSGVAERGLVAPAAGRPLLAAVLLLAAAVVLREVLLGLYPSSAYAFPAVQATLRVGTGFIRVADLVTIAVVAAVGAATAAVIRGTRAGAQLRVTAAAPAAAERMGIDTALVRTAAFAVAGAVAAGALLLGSTRYPIAASGGLTLALSGLAAAVAGGLRSPLRIAAAALAIAAVHVVAGFYLGGGGEVAGDAAAALLITLRLRR